MKWFYILNFLYLLLSSFAWPTNKIPDLAISLFGILIYLIFFISYKVKFNDNLASESLIIIFMIFVVYHVALGAYKISLSYIPGVLLCLLPNVTKRSLLSFITKWYSIIITISLAIYALSLISHLPSFGYINHYIYEPYINYFFYIKPTAIIQEFRFNGFFFEPGHCALIGSILLFANRYQLKTNKYLIPILLSILFSLSLAGYVLLGIGLFLLFGTKIKTIVTIILLSICGYIFVTDIWEEGHNPVNELIVARLEFDDKNGIKGNNRTYMDTDKVLNKAIKDNQIWTGIGIQRFNQLFNHSIAGSGYMIYILQYGLIGMSLVGILFWGFSLSATKNNRKYTRLFLVFLGLAFLQRSYAFWFSWQLPFICSIVNNPYISLHNDKEHG